MNVALYIARRYFSSRKKRNAVNIISTLSVVAVAVGTMGLIIVLSVFNGFGNLVVNLYDAFDADIKIRAKVGKYMQPDSLLLAKIRNHPQVSYASVVVEENVLLRYRNKQFLGRIKGVSEDFIREKRLSRYIIDGDYPDTNSQRFMIMGSGVAYALGLNINDPLQKVSMYMPKSGVASSLDPNDAFTQAHQNVSAVFAVQQDFDSKYIILPFDIAQQLLDGRPVISAIEVNLKPEAKVDPVKNEIESWASNSLVAQSKIEQHDFLYKILKTEKFAVFLILAFILLIATFTIIGSLTLLILDKKKDIVVLKSLGAPLSMVRKIFLTEGMFISLSGAFAGLLLGLIICMVQIHFGLLRIDSANAFLVEYYPVALECSDFAAVFSLVFIIGFISSYVLSRKLVDREYEQLLRSE
ncbi:MAG TPA: ABC transporter permease [Bacteroidia bacterium]|nr:ABC transporter permease [Bacteroidia bacterium]HNT79132.1 ABC transporter permease [Bacteroidia bacterium]